MKQLLLIQEKQVCCIRLAQFVVDQFFDGEAMNLNRNRLRDLIKLEMKKMMMDEDALFVMKDIPGDDDLFQDYSLDHLHDEEHMNHMSGCGCHECGDDTHEQLSYMARPQLEMIAQHAHDILEMLNSGKNLEEWQESHIAQIADDMIEVLHSLTYTNH
mgnify:CR=1 FL=1